MSTRHTQNESSKGPGNRFDCATTYVEQERSETDFKPDYRDFEYDLAVIWAAL